VVSRRAGRLLQHIYIRKIINWDLGMNLDECGAGENGRTNGLNKPR